MYCKNCGREINENTSVCLGCGCAVGGQRVMAKPYRPVSGFVLSLIIPIVGLIMSGIQYKKAKQFKGIKDFALAGIIIGAISCAYSLAVFVINLRISIWDINHIISLWTF